MRSKSCLLSVDRFGRFIVKRKDDEVSKWKEEEERLFEMER